MIPAISAEVAVFTRRHDRFLLLYPASLWSRWSAIDAGLGAVAAAAVCPRLIRNWRNGTRPIDCGRLRKREPNWSSPLARSVNAVSLGAARILWRRKICSISFLKRCERYG